jgi:hypothetical protein
MLTAALIIALMVYFIKSTTWKGMIFHPLAERCKNWPEKLRKPIFECPICMTPWWGTIIYLVGHYLDLREFSVLSVGRIVFTVFVAAGINTIFLMVNKIYDTLSSMEKEIT